MAIRSAAKKLLIHFLPVLTLAMPDPATAQPLKSCFVLWEPYTFRDSTGRLQGLSFSIYKEALNRAQLDMTFEEMPWARCKELVERGNYEAAVDGDAGIANIIQNALMPVPWVQSLWTNGTVPKNTFDNINALAGKSVGYVQGYGYPQEFLDHPEINSFAVANDTEGLRMLAANRFDFFFGDLVNNRQLQQKNKFDVQPVHPPIMITFLDLTFHKSQREAQAKYSKALASMLEDGTIDTIYRTYLGLSYQDLLLRRAEILAGKETPLN